jgi:hypothetical protein
VAKKAAREKFIRVVKRGEATADQLVAGAERFATQMRREDRPPDKICHPTTRLNQGRWEDETEAPKSEDVTAGFSPDERERYERMVEERRRGAA